SNEPARGARQLRSGPGRRAYDRPIIRDSMKYRIAAIAALALGIATASLQADIIEQVLVKVNGEIITKTDLEGRQIAALRQKNPNLRPDSDAALKAALAEVTPAVIVDAVDEMLMVQKGKELGYTMSTDRFNS